MRYPTEGSVDGLFAGDIPQGGTRVYVRGMWSGTYYSKRRKTAIQKGEAWLCE